ncbi:MAG: UMP kinase [Victivallaceae bacterium]|nr:UMP kinase [Victivallaceae bacterium]
MAEQQEQYCYKRILLKISGEALQGDAGHGYKAEAVRAIVETVRGAIANGIQLALVVGAGNLWRGVNGKQGGMDRVNADYMGMLATVMNALCLKDFFDAAGIGAVVQSAIEVSPFAPRYRREEAVKALEEGKVVIFAGGTGSPFFTTDSTAALRALELGCDAVLKATKVDGVYSSDPKKFPDAERFAKLSFDEALSRKLAVMDQTAFSLCRDNHLPIVVFDFSHPENLERILHGDDSVGSVID